VRGERPGDVASLKSFLFTEKDVRDAIEGTGPVARRLAGALNVGDKEGTMSVEENEATIRRIWDECNRGNLDVIDQCFADSFVRYDP
jgi:hypothetical protein